MSSDPQVERCLSSMRELSSALSDEVRVLSPEAWDTVTNCAPWRVKDLIAHLIVSGEGFAAAIREGLKGSVEPSISDHDRDHRQEMLAADGPANAARELDTQTDAFIGLYDGLDAARLETICFHRRGNRSVAWYAAHRLAEIAFHSWDIQVSLERQPSFPEDVAALLLPTLLESNAPRIYAASPTERRGTGERYALAVADDPSARWLITINPDTLTAERGDAPADVTITGPAAALALLVYGRFTLSDLFQSSAVHLEGDAALADRFASVYPRP